MKTKTRKLIGNILIWGGLIYIAYLGFSFLADKFINLLLAIIAILVGGFWGMRK